MHGDEVVSAATGVINVGTGVEATTDTLFQIGSITKIYTTTLIMQLVDEGRIDLDAPAVTYLPDELRFSTPEITSTVTVRHLLTHTSGVDGDYFKGHGRGDDCVAKYVADCALLPQVFPVGHMWSYCNAGFVVLGRIVETMLGMTWDDALRARILDPIGASQTQTHLEEALRYRVVVGHQIGADLAVSLPTKLLMERSTGPAGSTPYSSAAHLLKFAKMHIDGGVAADGTRVLSEASVRAMQEAQVDLSSAPGGRVAALKFTGQHLIDSTRGVWPRCLFLRYVVWRGIDHRGGLQLLGLGQRCV
jgi:CubicO group peptidase (beta-lactamase class C family)